MTERRETGRKPRKPAPSTPSSKQQPAQKSWDEGERIAKYLARAGVASRREIEALIEAGEVAVNGKALTTPAFKVTGRERITVRGKPVQPPEQTRLWRYHKPSGLVTTTSDPEGRPTVFEQLPKSLPRVLTVGRLDLTTEGLLLLTNDGELARRLELPSSGLKRVYRARAHGTVTPEALKQLADGVTVDGDAFGPIEAVLERTTGTNNWLKVSLAEGRKREVRRALEAVGLMVNRLIRVSYGPFELGKLQPGGVEEIPLSAWTSALDAAPSHAPRKGAPKRRSEKPKVPRPELSAPSRNKPKSRRRPPKR